MKKEESVTISYHTPLGETEKDGGEKKKVFSSTHRKKTEGGSLLVSAFQHHREGRHFSFNSPCEKGNRGKKIVLLSRITARGKKKKEQKEGGKKEMYFV